MAAFKALSLPGLDSVTVAMSCSREPSMAGVLVDVFVIVIIVVTRVYALILSGFA